MYTRRLLFSKWFQFGLVAILLVMLFVAGQYRRHVFYPTSDVVIDPGTGKYDPKHAEYLLPLVSEDNGTVTVDFGDAPGDVAELGAILALSAVIRMHPYTYNFNVRWDVEYPGYYPTYELNYDRGAGIIREFQTLNSVKNTMFTGKNLTDRDIHEAAKSAKDLGSWAARHWAK